MTAVSLVRSCGVDCTSTSPNYSLMQAYLHYLRHKCGREIHPIHSVGWDGEQPSVRCVYRQLSALSTPKASSKTASQVTMRGRR